MYQKIVSILLVPILFLFSLLPAAFGARNDEGFKLSDLKDLHTLSDYINYVQDHGAPSFDTDAFLRILAPGDIARKILHGQVLDREEEAYLDAQLDETLSSYCTYIAENTGFDLERLITHLPNLNGPAEFGAEVLHINTTELREKIFEKRDEADAEGDTFKANVFYLIGAYFSVIEKAEIRAVPSYRNPDEVMVEVTVTYYDGTKEVMYPGLFINTVTGEASGYTDTGMINLGFNCQIPELVVYATVGAWQRNLGFMLLYDILANTSPLFNYNTRRLKFDYNNKEWMIQIWKGNYALLTNGAEVGVYNREPGSKGTYYNCASDDELMNMTLQLYHGDDQLFSIGPMKHWWMNGFKLTKTIYQPKDLTMKFSIEMPDEEMLNAFAGAIDRDKTGDVTYVISGLTIYVTY